MLDHPSASFWDFIFPKSDVDLIYVPYRSLLKIPSSLINFKQLVLSVYPLASTFTLASMGHLHGGGEGSTYGSPGSQPPWSPSHPVTLNNLKVLNQEKNQILT